MDDNFAKLVVLTSVSLISYMVYDGYNYNKEIKKITEQVNEIHKKRCETRSEHFRKSGIIIDSDQFNCGIKSNIE